jgi:hypoxia up-regulated 1
MRTRTRTATLGPIMRRIALCALALWALGLLAPALGSLMAIDLGGEFLKVSVVAPGRTPISIAIKEMSRRKTPVLVGFMDDERVLGEAAVTAAGRYPDRVVGALRDLLGKPADDPSVRDLIKEQHLPYKLVPDPDRGTVQVALDAKSRYPIEALVVRVPSPCVPVPHVSPGSIRKCPIYNALCVSIAVLILLPREPPHVLLA